MSRARGWIAAGAAVLAVLAVPGAAQAQAEDACPNGWSPTATVEFAPPVPAIDTGVANVERANGCTLLDEIWRGEPFRNARDFSDWVAQLTSRYVRRGQLGARDKRVVDRAARRSGVGGPADVQVDNSCDRRIAFTFDDGVASYRPQTLQILRDQQVHGVFYDNGVRVAANPHIAVFQVREGHTQLSHTYSHPHLTQLSDQAVIDEVLRNEALFETIGAPLSFKGFRPPFFDADERVFGLIEGLGYNVSRGAVGTSDWDPATSAEQIHDDIAEQLEPGAVILLHDGPVDTPAGANSVAALDALIDTAREQGYCFGVTDEAGEVAASRYVASEHPIPGIVNPVPYNKLVRPGTPPEPFVFTDGPLAISATHSPAAFTQGQSGSTLTVVVENDSDEPTDDSTVTVNDEIPEGLTATAVAGNGWDCEGTETVTCTRAGVLNPGASYPPITITVDVAADAPATITHAPSVVGHGVVWNDEATDEIEVRPGPAT